MASAEANTESAAAPRMAAFASLHLSWNEVLEDPPSFAFVPRSEEEEAVEWSPLVSAFPVKTRLQSRRSKEAEIARETTALPSEVAQAADAAPEAAVELPEGLDRNYMLLVDMQDNIKV